MVRDHGSARPAPEVPGTSVTSTAMPSPGPAGDLVLVRRNWSHTRMPPGAASGRGGASPALPPARDQVKRQIAAPAATSNASTRTGKPVKAKTMASARGIRSTVTARRTTPGRGRRPSKRRWGAGDPPHENTTPVPRPPRLNIPTTQTSATNTPGDLPENGPTPCRQHARYAALCRGFRCPPDPATSRVRRGAR